MKKSFLTIFTGLTCLCVTLSAQTSKNTPAWLQNALKVVEYQLLHAARHYTPGDYPRSVTCDNVKLVNYQDWTSGFFPGSLWYGYELTANPQLREQAKRFTLSLDSVRYIKSTHDLGFMLYCSYGNAWRITGDKSYLPALRDGAVHLNARFNPKAGVIRSWEFGRWQFPVIIDNMMNLEYLYWAAGQFHEPQYATAANTHASTTIKNHFRKDYSSYHVIGYDSTNGRVLSKGTHQGLSDASAWARGQAWALYGYAMCYANSKNTSFLKQAEHIAAFIMNHPNMPADKIAVWDFDVHNADRADTDKRVPRDASAAAVIACGLFELSKNSAGGQKYFDYAEQILQSLSSAAYLSQPGENHYFILKHSVGNFLFNSEIDTPLNYADYYYLEALKKYMALKKIK